jgi:hypothetical protein
MTWRKLMEHVVRTGRVPAPVPTSGTVGCAEARPATQKHLRGALVQAASRPRCAVCGDRPLSPTDGPNGEPMERVCGACTDPPDHLAEQHPSGDPRCEDCGHPMSEGTWEDRSPVKRTSLVNPDRLNYAVWQAWFRWAMDALREGQEPPDAMPHSDDPAPVHFSPCDEGCRHGGPGRWKAGEHPNQRWIEAGGLMHNEAGLLYVQNGLPVEASWRPVDVRTLGWPQPERLAVLCLRCYADRAHGPGEKRASDA